MSQKVKVLIAILLTFAWSTSLSGRGVDRISDEDMREIVALLFQRELQPDPDGKEIVVLVGPNFPSAWIPTLSGFQIRQLSYEEQKLVPEYYDLTVPGGRGGNKFGLAKGNYCQKTGSVFGFRKHNGKWLAEPDSAFDSGTSPGTVCIGCKTGSGAVYSIGRSQPGRSAGAEATQDPLLKGRVLKVSCQRIQPPYIECLADLSLALTNKTSEPLIVLQPIGEYDFWHGGTSLALSPSESDGRREVYSYAAWPSFYHFPGYQNLAKLLDQSSPPANVTRVIQPNDSWEWQRTVRWALQEDNNCSGSVGVEIGWNEIKKLPAPLWLRVHFEMWPFNAENFRTNLGRNLRKRWRQFGDLYLEESNDRYSSWHLTSEPIELDLRKVELIAQKSDQPK